MKPNLIFCSQVVGTNDIIIIIIITIIFCKPVANFGHHGNRTPMACEQPGTITVSQFI